MQGYDYTSEGYYFVTICTKDRVCYFGNVIDQEMYLSEIGKIAEAEWLKTETIRKNVKLDEFVVMPNHVHGIVCIGDNGFRNAPQVWLCDSGIGMVGTLGRDVATQRLYDGVQRHALRRPDGTYHIVRNPKMSQISPKPHSLSTIIRAYKSAVTRCCNKNNHEFQWQSRFYDRIIRDEDELNRIRIYIKNNPMMWNRDWNNL